MIRASSRTGQVFALVKLCPSRLTTGFRNSIVALRRWTALLLLAAWACSAFAGPAELQQRPLEQRWLLIVLVVIGAALAGAAYLLHRLRRSHRMLDAVHRHLQQSQGELERQSGMLQSLNADLEQRVQARTAELRQQARYLRTLVDTLPLWVWMKDTHSRYVIANNATADACGMSLEEIVGKADEELWPEELARAYVADDNEVMESRQRKTVEERLVGVKRTSWIETFKAPVIDEDGTVLGTVGAARDISERKATEAAREAALAEAERLAQQRSEFLAQMSHELRTPLNGILGFAQILRLDKPLTDRQARGLGIIYESGQHLLALINDILDLSRIDAAKLDLFPTEIDLRAFLGVVSDIVRVKAEEKGVLFVHESGPDLPTTVRTDEKRLRQVLLNLLSNAVKFTDSGRVTLRVHRLSHGEPALAAQAGPGGGVRLGFEIEDSGIGMTADQLARIFQPFEQVSDTRRRAGGAGLGLAISQRLVHLMGGEIQVRSEPGHGSVFWFELELPVAKAPTARPYVHGTVIGYEGPRRKILIVDDVSQNRAMLIDSLSVLGFECGEATNGAEGLEQAAQCHPDLIVMDIMMPVMDGFEATRRMRLLPGLEHVPILAASASTTPEIEALSYQAGANAFISKPIEQSALLATIGQHLNLHWVYDDVVSQV